MAIIYYGLIVALGAKILWNFAVPYAAIVRASRSQSNSRNGVSLMMFVEWVAILLAAGVAELAHESTSLMLGSLTTLLVGSAAAMLSYLHGAIVLAIARRSRETEDEQDDGRRSGPAS